MRSPVGHPVNTGAAILRSQLGDRHFAFIAAARPESRTAHDRLLAVACGNAVYGPASENLPDSVAALMTTCWGRGYTRGTTDLGGITDHAAQEIHLLQKIMVEADTTHWRLAEACLGAADNGASLLQEWTGEARCTIERFQALIKKQRDWRLSAEKGYQHDPALPERSCPVCGVTYRGSKDVCSWSCDLERQRA